MKASSRTNKEILQWTLPRLIGAGYGLFSRKAADPRWPEIFITAFVLKKYRGKSSVMFMLKSGYEGMRRHETASGETKALIAKLAGSEPKHLFQLSGIYTSLSRERGPAIATAAFIEIVKIVNEKRKRSSAWWRVQRASPRALNRPRARRFARKSSRR